MKVPNKKYEIRRRMERFHYEILIRNSSLSIYGGIECIVTMINSYQDIIMVLSVTNNEAELIFTLQHNIQFYTLMHKIICNLQMRDNFEPWEAVFFLRLYFKRRCFFLQLVLLLKNYFLSLIFMYMSIKWFGFHFTSLQPACI